MAEGGDAAPLVVPAQDTDAAPLVVPAQDADAAPLVVPAQVAPAQVAENWTRSQWFFFAVTFGISSAGAIIDGEF